MIKNYNMNRKVLENIGIMVTDLLSDMLDRTLF